MVDNYITFLTELMLSPVVVTAAIAVTADTTAVATTLTAARRIPSKDSI